MPIRSMSEMRQNKAGEIIPLPRRNSPQSDTTDVSLGLMEVAPGGSVRPHTHDRLEVYIVMSGRAKMMAGDDIRLVSAGDVLIAPIGAPHAIQTIGAEPLVYYGLNSPPVATAPMVEAPAAVQKRFDEA